MTGDEPLAWGPGFHPKNVFVEDVHDALLQLREPSPENLLDATKNPNHILHEEIWEEGDQVWATRGRLAHCRKIIHAVHKVMIVGGAKISVRAVEFVRPEGEGQWVHLSSIQQDDDLKQAYLDEIIRLQDQAAAKMEKFRQLMQDDRPKKRKKRRRK